MFKNLVVICLGAIGKLKVERFVDNDPHGTRFAMLADISHRLLKKARLRVSQ